jgi:hypothetical protein
MLPVLSHGKWRPTSCSRSLLSALCATYLQPCASAKSLEGLLASCRDLQPLALEWAASVMAAAAYAATRSRRLVVGADHVVILQFTFMIPPLAVAADSYCWSAISYVDIASVCHRSILSSLFQSAVCHRSVHRPCFRLPSIDLVHFVYR